MDSAAHDGSGGDRKRKKAGINSRLLPASDKRREGAAFGEVSAARSASVVDGRKAVDIGAHRRQDQPTDYAHLGDLNQVVRSDHVTSTADGGGRCREKNPRILSQVPVASERGEVSFGAIMAASTAPHGAHRRARAPERREACAGEDSASTSASALNGSIRLSSRSSTAPPADDIFGDEENRIKAPIKAHRQSTAPGSGKVHAGDQEVPSTSSNPFGKPTPSQHRKPAEAAAQENGGIDLYRLGLEAAMAMDDETILSVVAKYVGVEAQQQQIKATAAADAPEEGRRGAEGARVLPPALRRGGHGGRGGGFSRQGR